MMGYFRQRFRDEFGVSMLDFDRTKSIKDCKYPLMLTAGSMENQDEVLAGLKQSNPQATTVLILPGCNHGNGMYKQTEMYQSAIKEFVHTYMDT